MWRGVRARTTAVAAVVVVVVLVATAAVLLGVQRRMLTDNLDQALVAQARLLADAVAEANPAHPLAPQGDDDGIAQVTTLDGVVLASTANFADRPALTPPATSIGGDEARWTAELLEGEPDYRVVSMRVEDRFVHVAAPVDDIDESLSALRLGFAGAIPVVATVLAGLTWWLVGRTLRPVEAIRREVTEMTGENLHRRVPEPAGRDEIHRLALTMNEMLDRVERAAGSQRQFVGDASHELRSPLARIRSELEVDLAHPETADMLSTHESVLEEAKQLERLVDDLLVLARFDDDRARQAPAVSVDLDDVVLREVRRVRAGLRAGVVVDTAAVSGAQVHGDAAELARLVRNLLDNAARHAVSVVEVSLSERAGMATLAVADDGPGIAPDQRALVFERFGRVDGARSRDAGGSGLGLAICRAIVERHRGTIGIDAEHRRGARFVVRIPAAP